MHWEHGYRCHGLWRGGKRVAHISLPPYGFPVTYYWNIDLTEVDGYGKSLRDAKVQVRRALEKRGSMTAVRQTGYRHRSGTGGFQAVLRENTVVVWACWHAHERSRGFTVLSAERCARLARENASYANANQDRDQSVGSDVQVLNVTADCTSCGRTVPVARAWRNGGWRHVFQSHDQVDGTWCQEGSLVPLEPPRRGRRTR